MSNHQPLKEVYRELSEFAKKHNLVIITATQIKPYNPYYAREITEEAQFILMDYIDNMKAYDDKEEVS